MSNYPPNLETLVEMSCSECSFNAPTDVNTKHNFQILSSILSNGSGYGDLVWEEDKQQYTIPVYNQDEIAGSDLCNLYTMGNRFQNRGIVIQSSPLQPSFLNIPTEIETPSTLTLLERKGFSEGNIKEEEDSWELNQSFSDLNLKLSFKLKEGRLLLTVSSTKISAFDELTPLEEIEMVPLNEARYVFGANEGREILGDSNRYQDLGKFIQKCTGPDGSLNGIRAKSIALKIDEAGSNKGEVLLAISV